MKRKVGGAEQAGGAEPESRGTEPKDPRPESAVSSRELPGDAAAAPVAPLDPRALRIAVAADRRLPGDEPVTVSPAPVPVRPLDSDLAETGQFGGIAHHSRRGGSHAARPARAASVPPGSADERAAPEPAADGATAEQPAQAATVLIVDGHPRRVRLERIDSDHAILEFDNAPPDPSAEESSSTHSVANAATTADPPSRVRVVLGAGDRRRADGVVVQEVVVDGWRFELELESERRAALRDRARRGHETAGHAGPLEIHAIIPGRIVAISVSPGEAVEAGQQLLVEEAMKMQNELRAPREGEIERIAVAVGDTVDVGDLLMVIS